MLILIWTSLKYKSTWMTDPDFGKSHTVFS